METFQIECAKYQETLRRKFEQRVLKRRRKGLPIKWPTMRIGAMPQELKSKCIPPEFCMSSITYIC